MSSTINFLKSMGTTYKQKYIALENSININIVKKVYLSNYNFKNGTVIIAPQYYLITGEDGISIKIDGSTKNTEFILEDNIIFNPNSVLSMNPHNILDKSDLTTQQEQQYTTFLTENHISDSLEGLSDNQIDKLNIFWTDMENATNPAPTANSIAKAGRVLPEQYEYYPQDAYGLGFFCAISIYTSDIILNLNGYEIKQSSEHALQQRFYSNIELASIPFLPSQGPHTFGSKIKRADNCIIKDGVLGRSSHHSIHGNLASNIIIKNITAYDYEVGIIGLNGVRNIYIDHVIGQGHRSDIPVLGIFSTTRFIWPFLDALETYERRNISGGDYTKSEFINNGGGSTEWDAATSTMITLDISGTALKIKTIKVKIENDIASVYNAEIDYTTGEKKTDITNDIPGLYKNEKKFVDGNSYGILINQIGVAVNGFPISRQEPSENIYITDLIIKNHIGFVNEIPALENPNGGHEKDPVGSVFQTQNKDIAGTLMTINEDGTYKGNAVSNAQLYVAKAITNNENFFQGKSADKTPCVKRNSISDRTVNWAEGNDTTLRDVSGGDGIANYLFNGDSMFHVNKGLVTCKLDAIEGLYVENCVISNCWNQTDEWPRGKNNLSGGWDPSALSDEKGHNYSLYSNGLGKSHPSATYNGSGAHNIRAWSLSSSRNCFIKNCATRNVKSNLGKAIGYDIHQDSDNIYLINCSSYNIDGGVDIISTDKLVELSENRTMKLPKCIGYRAGPKTNNVVFQDCDTDGANESPLDDGVNSIEILSKTSINIKT